MGIYGLISDYRLTVKQLNNKRIAPRKTIDRNIKLFNAIVAYFHGDN